jgi:hypothetical protein
MALNESIGKTKTEASLIKQVFIGLVDIVLALILVTLVLIYETPGPLFRLVSSINPTLLILLWLVAYRLISFIAFNGTVGMKLFGVVLLNGEQKALTIIEKILASVFILYKGVDYYND